MRLSFKSEWLHWLLLASMWVLAIVAWPTSPDRIPVHWNFAGDVDRYGGKFEGLLLVPIVATLVYLMFLFIPLIDPLRKNYASFASAYSKLRFVVLLVLAGIYGFMHLSMRDVDFNMSMAIGLLVGVLFMFLGGLMTHLEPNWFVGVRTPWTLSSRRSWDRTHAAARWVFVVLGLMVMASSLASSAWVFGVVIVGLLAGTLWLVVYSYRVWKNDPEKASLEKR